MLKVKTDKKFLADITTEISICDENFVEIFCPIRYKV